VPGHHFRAIVKAKPSKSRMLAALILSIAAACAVIPPDEPLAAEDVLIVMGQDEHINAMGDL